MTEWSLSKLLSGLHDDIERRLAISRESFGHSVTKGEASEGIWIALLNDYMPRRYSAAKAHVVDSDGRFSDQIDVVVFDRQFSPFIFNFEGKTVIPAESVYAVFEAKQSINAEHVNYAQSKVATVRRLQRTSLPIPHAGGTYPAKPLIRILGGLLTFDSDWSPPMGEPLFQALAGAPLPNGRLDLGCIAAHGYFRFDEGSVTHKVYPGGKPATAFLFQLISELQFVGTVPMIDVQAYARWLTT